METDYCSLRIRLAHDNIDDMIKVVLKGLDDYIIYSHKKGSTNEHVHILIPITPSESNKERYRKRARTYLGVSGRSNAVCIKGYTNGIQSGCTYGGKRGDIALVSSDRMQIIAESAPAWVHHPVQPVLSSKDGEMTIAERAKVRDWQLTYSNLVPQAVIHYAKNPELPKNLFDVVKHMLDHTKWFPCHQMVKQGVDSAYEDHFLARIGAKKSHNMSWFRKADYLSGQ